MNTEQVWRVRPGTRKLDKLDIHELGALHRDNLYGALSIEKQQQQRTLELDWYHSDFSSSELDYKWIF